MNASRGAHNLPRSPALLHAPWCDETWPSRYKASRRRHRCLPLTAPLSLQRLRCPELVPPRLVPPRQAPPLLGRSASLAAARRRSPPAPSPRPVQSPASSPGRLSQPPLPPPCSEQSESAALHSPRLHGYRRALGLALARARLARARLAHELAQTPGACREQSRLASRPLSPPRPRHRRLPRHHLQLPPPSHPHCSKLPPLSHRLYSKLLPRLS